MKHIMLLIGVLIAALPANVLAAELTREICEADYAAMVKTAKENRARSITELEAALRFTTNDDAAGDLAQQIERTWELEETFLKHASNFYRDCVKHVESGGS